MGEDWAGGASIGGLAIPSEPDLVRLRADRHAKIQTQLEAQGIDGLVLLGSGNVAYATGADSPGEDSGRAGLFRPVAIVVRGESEPHLYTAYWDGGPPSFRPITCTGRSSPTSTTASAVRRGPAPSCRAGSPSRGRRADPPDVAGPRQLRMDRRQQCAGAAKIIKTPDEISAIRAAQRLTELAMEGARAALRPGLRQTELSGIFLRRIFELGATANAIDPIWQVMAPTRAGALDDPR